VLSFEKISRARQAKNRDCASPIQAPQKPSTFIRTHKETLSVAAMASATKIVRPRQSTAAAQPQLQPALLRLSAMICQYFTRSGV
jgi:hypothetical protein